MVKTNKGDPVVDAMDESELARYFEEHKDDDSIWAKKGVKLPKIRSRRGPSTIFQMRIAPDELKEIALAAGGNISDFVRTAALEKARKTPPRTRETLRDELTAAREAIDRAVAAL